MPLGFKNSHLFFFPVKWMTFACFSCQKNFATRHALDIHVYPGTVCVVCDQHICKNTNMFKHLHSCLHNSTRHCSGCHRYFYTYDDLCEHIVAMKCWNRNTHTYIVPNNKRVIIEEKLTVERVVVPQWQCLYQIPLPPIFCLFKQFPLLAHE